MCVSISRGNLCGNSKERCTTIRSRIRHKHFHYCGIIVYVFNRCDNKEKQRSHVECVSYIRPIPAWEYVSMTAIRMEQDRTGKGGGRGNKSSPFCFDPSWSRLAQLISFSSTLVSLGQLPSYKVKHAPIHDKNRSFPCAYTAAHAYL